MMKPEENYYDILGVAADVSQEEITRAFKQALKELPEDITEAEERRNRLEKAYYVLGDEMRRFEYDRVMFHKKFPASNSDTKPPSSETNITANTFHSEQPLSKQDQYYERLVSAGRARKQGRDKRPSAWILAGLFLFVYVLGKAWLPGAIPEHELENLPAVSTDSLMPQPDIPPLELPPGGEVHYYTGGEPLAPFSVNTAEGSNYFVKLVDPDTKSEVVTMFVRGGEWAETKVPLGNYELRYASGGQDWYGEEYLFGTATVCVRASQELSFYQDESRFMGHSVILIKQAGGNLYTQPMALTEF
ncbi:MAG TPA: DnaJ domain-containing protein [Syntrophomonadaceae bacterium]|nr:DnaJ domain-containing protein [Syntrophomonadaceae bacterium]